MPLSAEEVERLKAAKIGRRGYAESWEETRAIVAEVPDFEIRRAEQMLNALSDCLRNRVYDMGNDVLTRWIIQHSRSMLDIAEDYLNGEIAPPTEKEEWLESHLYLDGEEAGEQAWTAFCEWREQQPPGDEYND